jgi:all-trans-retinol 13,14-reductase
MKKYDVLIIGSGISALTAGVILGRQGKSVLILEQHTKIGGYLHCFKRFGEKFDTGAHYVGSNEPNQAYYKLMNFLGVWNEDDYVELDPRGFDEFHFPTFKFSIPKGYGEFERRLIERFPREEKGIKYLLGMIQTAVKYFTTYQLHDFVPGTFPPEIFDRSLASVVDAAVSDPALKYIFYTYCSHHGALPDDVSFGFHSIIIDTLVSGAYGFKHGGDVLAERFRAELAKTGGEILTKQRVTRLEVDGKVIKAVHTDKGDVFQADWIISSMHPRSTFDVLDDTSAMSNIFKSRIHQLKEGPSFFGIYAVLKNDGTFSGRKNYFFFNSEDGRDFGTETRPQDPPSVIFMSASRRLDDAGATGFPVNIHALAPYEWFDSWAGSRYGRRPAEYKEHKNLIAQRIFAAMEKHHPGFTARIEKFETSSPLSHLHFNGSHQGSSYGIYHSMAQTGPRAIGPRTKILNLLLTGQNSLFPGLLGSAISGLRTAGHIVGIKPLLQDLKTSRAEERI